MKSAIAVANITRMMKEADAASAAVRSALSDGDVDGAADAADRLDLVLGGLRRSMDGGESIMTHPSVPLAEKSDVQRALTACVSTIRAAEMALADAERAGAEADDE